MTALPGAAPIFGIYSDAAKRASDAVNGALAAHGENAWGKWLALRLSDGSSDGVLYDRRSEAVRHQLHETQCAYVKIPPDGMSPRAADRFLAINRAMYDAGYRFADPEVDREPIIPITIEEYQRWMTQLRRGPRL